jgi:deoxyribose-phosphate aldolase
MSTARTQLRDWRAVAAVIDHTLLKAEATPDQIRRVCDEAIHYGFHTVCVHPAYAALAVSILRATPVKAGSVVGFPQGMTLTSVKRFEAAELVKLGVDELDMVLNVGAVKSGNRLLAEADVRAVTHVAHEAGVVVKVIIETCLLTAEETVLACKICLAADADFVKTSTGLAGAGATVENVAIMRSVVGNRAGVKAAGGIRTARDVAAMLSAGADRIGCSASVAIMKELGA